MKLNSPIPQSLPKECEKAAKIFKSFVDSGNNGLDGVIPRSILEHAKGFAIFTIIKAGFLVSARAGSGVVIAKLDDGTWSAPSAIGTAGIGGGAQIGAEVTDFLVVLNTRTAVQSFMSAGSVTLGGNMSVALGPLGRNGEAAGAVNTKGQLAAMYSYSKTRGLFGGISVEGSVIVERQDANTTAYGSHVTARMLLGGVVDPPPWTTVLTATLEACTGMPGNRKWVNDNAGMLDGSYIFRGLASSGGDIKSSSTSGGLLKKKKDSIVTFPPASWGVTQDTGLHLPTPDTSKQSWSTTKPTDQMQRDQSTNPNSQLDLRLDSNYGLSESRHSRVTKSLSTTMPTGDLFGSSDSSRDGHFSKQRFHAKSLSVENIRQTKPSNPYDTLLASGKSDNSSSELFKTWQTEQTSPRQYFKPHPDLTRPLLQHEGVARAIALYDFQAVEPGDLSFSKGDVIIIAQKSDSTDDWWTGKLNDRKGLFPANFVEITLPGHWPRLNSLTARPLIFCCMYFRRSTFSLNSLMSMSSRSIFLQHASLDRIDIPSKMTIQLSDTEAQVCSLLDGCSIHLKTEKGIQTSCRIAGGWVRDKLLGQPDSHDIDIALSGMMGVPFAENFATYASSKSIETGTISKIAQNPDQSKHLETATFKVLGLTLDLVNLRSERYADDSRIPIDVAFGTPLEDALRRDATINSLFYNIHTSEVEDHTGKGLEDLRNGIIRTPLSPRETFQDDPLRILRCIRFASRFGFKMVPEIFQAAKDPVIQDHLITKVARERVGEEVSKMMKGRDPLGALQHICNLSLYDVIFAKIPPQQHKTFSASSASPLVGLTAAYIFHRLFNPSDSLPIPSLHPSLLSHVLTEPSCKARLFLAAAVTPYKGITYQGKKSGKTKAPSAVELVIRESLKLGTQHHFLDGIPALFDSAEKLRDPRLEKFQSPSERVAIGLLLRDKEVHNPNTGTHWTTSVLFSLVQELVPLYDIVDDKLNVPAVVELVELYNTFTQKIEELHLPGTIEAKSVLNGHEVQDILGQSDGKWMQTAMKSILEWQLGNPGGSKEECIVWLRERYNGDRLPEEESSEPANKKIKRG